MIAFDPAEFANSDLSPIKMMASLLKRRPQAIHMYYRRPASGNQPGWITVGSAEADKQMMFMARGFVPLYAYGHVTDSDDRWGPILRHPQGPAEFPAEQVLTYRWHREPQPFRGVREAIDRLYFPQLAGKDVLEFDCPECEDRSFFKAVHLARHLRLHHGYDRGEILALGTELGIDFSKEIAAGGRRITAMPVRDLTAEEPTPEAPVLAGPSIERVRPRGRGLLEVGSE